MNINPHAPVVVGIAASDEAACATDYGAWEAGRRGVELHLVHAYRPALLWGAGSVVDDGAWERERVRAVLGAAVREVAQAHPDVTVRPFARTGGAASVLVEGSRTAGLVVVGTGATGGARGYLTASVAAQVTAHGHSPVVVMRGCPGRHYEPSTWERRPVVVGVDGSDGGRLAIEFAVEQAVARAAQLWAVFAWSVVDLHDIGEVLGDRYDAAEAASKADRLVAEALTGWADRYPDLRIRTEAVRDPSPVRALIDRAEGAGLVVVGSRGVGGFAGLLLGSTVDGLVRHSPVPVAVVHGGS
jgi:nucleotide-binding universal stress UspA family protein